MRVIVTWPPSPPAASTLCNSLPGQQSPTQSLPGPRQASGPLPWLCPAQGTVAAPHPHGDTVVRFTVPGKLSAGQGSPGSLRHHEGVRGARSPCPGSCQEKTRGCWRPPPWPWAPRRPAQGHLGGPQPLHQGLCNCQPPDSWGAREAADLLEECGGQASGQERAVRAAYAPLSDTRTRCSKTGAAQRRCCETVCDPPIDQEDGQRVFPGGLPTHTGCPCLGPRPLSQTSPKTPASVSGGPWRDPHPWQKQGRGCRAHGSCRERG